MRDCMIARARVETFDGRKSRIKWCRSGRARETSQGDTKKTQKRRAFEELEAGRKVVIAVTREAR